MLQISTTLRAVLLPKLSGGAKMACSSIIDGIITGYFLIII